MQLRKRWSPKARILIETEFTLDADYEDGEWIFRHYNAVANDLLTGSHSEIEVDKDSGAPPAIATMMGLKIAPSPVQPPAIVSDQGTSQSSLSKFGAGTQAPIAFPART